MNINERTLYRLLTSSNRRLRLLRNLLLWLIIGYVIFSGFLFLSRTIPAYSAETVRHYTFWSTLFFGTLTVLCYYLITYLSYRFILIQFRIGRFLLWMAVIHITASLLIFAHFRLFIDLFGENSLPRFYATYRQYFQTLPLWQVPFDYAVVWIFAFSFFYNYLLYAVGFKVFKDLFTLRAKQNELEKENIKLEFEFLKSQVNPHFLFNTLNNIYSFSLASPDKVPDTILKLADLMRYSLYETNEEYVSLQKEINFLTSYIELERVRHDDDVRIEFTVRGKADQKKVPPLLFILFVENAFKHGIQSSAQSSWVEVELDISSREIVFEVRNSIPTNRRYQTGGLGLKNVRKRLDYFYPDNYNLDIKGLSVSFNVKLTLPLDGEII